MRLYCTPGGTWAGTEKDWKAAVRAEGLDPKDISRRIVEVPTSKAELMEFLSFYNVNCIGGPLALGVDVNVNFEIVPPSTPAPSSAGESRDTTVSDLDAAFAAAPIKQQLRLAVAAIDAADARLNGAAP